MTEHNKVVMQPVTNKGSVQIEVYTDPLCCWSWAMEPQWRRLRYEFKEQLKWRYHMGGLIPNWSSYSDPLNSVTKPIQMGPVWLEAKYTSGMPLQDTIWYSDPPASSYPACLAVKVANLQSADAAERYLRRIREAVMLDGRNIAKREVLLEVAQKLSEEKPEVLDFEKFKQDLGSEAARKAFEEDLRKVSLHKISRFPALAITRAGEATGLLIVGYRPYEALVKALQQVAPELEPLQHAADAESYTSYWGSATTREVEEALAATKQNIAASGSIEK